MKLHLEYSHYGNRVRKPGAAGSKSDVFEIVTVFIVDKCRYFRRLAKRPH